MKRITPASAARLASIAAILLTVTAALAFAGGVFSPGRLGPGAIVDALQVHDGLHPGFRRAHAKGLCIAGTFQSNGNGTALSKAQVFTSGTVPVIASSRPGGRPYAPDGRLVSMPSRAT